MLGPLCTCEMFVSHGEAIDDAFARVYLFIFTCKVFELNARELETRDGGILRCEITTR